MGKMRISMLVLALVLFLSCKTYQSTEKLRGIEDISIGITESKFRNMIDNEVLMLSGEDFSIYKVTVIEPSLKEHRLGDIRSYHFYKGILQQITKSDGIKNLK